MLHGIENVHQPRAHFSRVDRTGDLDAALGVARHHIGRGNVHLLFRAAAEHKDARVLEEAADDARDRDVFCVPLHAGQQAADAAHDHFDAHARAGRVAQLADDVDIGQGVELEQHISFRAAVDLFVHAGKDIVFQAARRDQQAVVPAFEVTHRHVVEECARVRANRLIRGDE